MAAHAAPRSSLRDSIVAALRPEAVLSHFGIEPRASGDELRLRLCPACGPRGRDCVCIHRVTGQWFDHAHGCKGDVLDLVAGLGGLDCATHFPEVLSLAAQIAGLDGTASTTSLPAKRAVDPFAWSSDDASRRAGAVWSRLQSSSTTCATYLERRGLGALAERADLVRFAPLATEPMTPWGRKVERLLGRPSVCVAVHSIDDGVIVNVVARRLEVRSDDDPKVVSLPGLKKVLHGRLVGTFGAWTSFRATPRDVVVVEGVFDYLTAVHLWPDKLVVGSDGAALLPKIAALVAPAVRDAGVRLLFVPHNDRAGYLHGRMACAELTRATMPTDRVVFVDVGRHKDLNDALVAGEAPRVD